MVRDSPPSFSIDSRFGSGIAAMIAVSAGAIVYWLTTTVFAYHSSNHDEGVYLQQATMLLDGRLVMEAGDLVGAFRPWFFIVEAGSMYPKYSPVPAGIFATGKLVFGSFDPILAAIAVLNVLLVYAIVTEAFDRATGIVAALVLVGSPLFLVTSSVFLPYAPTTLFNLAFALSYIRAVRRDHLGYAAMAGIAIGIAFFARPYTAVLFALPFVGHAIVVLARAWRTDPPVRRTFVRSVLIAACGLTFVAITFAYNALVTGDPFVFPYEAFAPRDGIGFGRREILGYERNYDLPLALRANAIVLYEFVTDWLVAGPLSVVLAFVGIGFAFGEDSADGDAVELSDRMLRYLLFAIAASVVIGNVGFWGNLNIVADFDNPDDGLISLFGPFYHFDLLLPVSAFVATGMVNLVRRVTSEANRRFDPKRAKAVLLVLLVLTVPVFAVAEQQAVERPVEVNAAFAEKYERAYEPFENREFENALVFLPTPYGYWLNHPFQYLRNTPGLDGDRLLAAQRDPAGDFAVVDAHPNRTLYRYTYRGRWVPSPRPQVEPTIQPLDVREGRNLTIQSTVGVPHSATRATIRIENGGSAVQYAVTEDFDENLTVNWSIAPTGTRVVSDNVQFVGAGGSTLVPVANEHPTVLTITFSQPGSSTVTYRQEIAAEDVNGKRVRAIWPPESSVCRLVMDCGYEGTYLPESNDFLPGVQVNATISVVESE